MKQNWHKQEENTALDMHSMDIRRKSPFTTPQLHCSKFSARRNSILSLFPFCSLPGTSQNDLGCTLYKWMLCAGIQVKGRRRKEKRWQLLSCIKQLRGHNHASTVYLKFAQSIKVNKMKLFLKWKKKKSWPDCHLLFRKATQIQKDAFLRQKLPASHNTVM